MRATAACERYVADVSERELPALQAGYRPSATAAATRNQARRLWGEMAA